MIVSLVAASDVPAKLVNAIVAETDAIWRGTGIIFFWQRQARESAPPMPSPYRTPMLRVQIGHERHAAAEWKLPLGWIVFDDPATPEQEIYLSYENALALLDKSDGVVGQDALDAAAPARDAALARARTRAGARARPLPSGVEGSHGEGPDDGRAYGR